MAMKGLLALLAVSGLTAGPARAAYFTVAFIGPGVDGSALLEATDNGNGTFTAVAGAGTLTVNGVTTPITLVPNPNAPGGTAPFAGGLYYYDNQLLPNLDPVLTYGGLLFVTQAGVEENMFANGPGDYALYEDTPGVGETFFGPVRFSLAPAAVPEPAGLALLGVGGLGLAARRVLRRTS